MRFGIDDEFSPNWPHCQRPYDRDAQAAMFRHVSTEPFEEFLLLRSQRATITCAEYGAA